MLDFKTVYTFVFTMRFKVGRESCVDIGMVIENQCATEFVADAPSFVESEFHIDINEGATSHALPACGNHIG